MMPPPTVGLGKLRLHASRGSCPERALEISELRYRRLFETAQDGILILNGDTGKIIDANPFLLDLLDYPFESIIGRQLWEIGLFNDIDANKAAFARLQTATPKATRYFRGTRSPSQPTGMLKIV